MFGKQGRKSQGASGHSIVKRSQGAFEYILLLGGVLLIVVVAVIILRGSVLNQANKQIGSNVNVWQQYTDAKCFTANMVSDGGFENGTGWTFQGVPALGTGSITSEKSYSGSKSAKITKTTTLFAAGVAVNQSIILKAGKKYRLSCMHFLDTLGTVGTYCDFQDIPEDMDCGFNEPKGSWIMTSCTTAPMAADRSTSVRAAVDSFGPDPLRTGTAYIDDICVIEVP